ncbi:OB-fold domain-containing protein [Saccharopolyspora sp. HNM0983]|uniref:OB-fold domain-containing protein n=1 Tax=Saccharopolyspora montiporae TaxID=2781240 RepID=A0A929BAT4_9PSEU|nr:OB-fold domain-containing protein [Saccharopolyspora sp. HNM0983]MBE9374606.1 OB-fold domain-containing protein [Saccharopolyspora sp. HNM0983]
MPVHPLQRDAESAPFFDAAAEGRLLIRRDRTTGALISPTEQTGPDGSADLEWVPAAGSGTITSWAVVHDKPDADGRTNPLVVAIVELAEGPWLRAQIVRTAPDEVRTGMAVTVEFEQPAGGEAIPVFAPG